MARTNQLDAAPSEAIEVDIVRSDSAISIAQFREMWFDHPEWKVEFVGDPKALAFPTA